MPGLGGTLGRRALHRRATARPSRRRRRRRSPRRRGGAAPAIVTGCAVRGIETAAGRVAAVVTEKGRIACQSVVLAGGAWSRLFCGNLGIELPQLKVLALGDAHRAARRRPGNLRLGRPVRLPQADGWRLHGRDARGAHDRPRPRQLPAVSRTICRRVRLHWKKLRFRVGRRLVEEWRTPRRWALDEASPFEAVRVLDPERRPVCRSTARAPHRRGLPGLPQRRRRGELGRHDRRDAGCDPGDLAGRERCPAFLSRPAFPATASASAPAPAGWSPTWSPATRPSSTRRRSACRASPTARTRGRTRWRADTAREQPRISLPRASAAVARAAPRRARRCAGSPRRTRRAGSPSC